MFAKFANIKNLLYLCTEQFRRYYEPLSIIIMATLGYSFYPLHPGEVLKDEMEARHISQREFARQVDMSYTVLTPAHACVPYLYTRGAYTPSGYTLRLRLYTRSTAYAAANANSGHTASPIGFSFGPCGSDGGVSPPSSSEVPLLIDPGLPLCMRAGE